MRGLFALAAAVGLIGANALFVAAEFSMVAVSRGEIEERAAQGDRRAGRVRQAQQRLSFVLSAAQFGITATSLLLGFVAAVAISETVMRPLARALGLADSSGTALVVTGAVLVSTAVQMVVGELAPKNLAIARPLRVSLAVSLPMRVFELALGPVIRLFDRAAGWVARVVLRTELDDELSSAYTLDELAQIIEASGAEGTLSGGQARLLTRAVELGGLRISEVMVAWPDVRVLRADATGADLRDLARETGHSRFPVVDANDDVVGTVHLKDLLGPDVADYNVVPVERLATPVVVVPETGTAQSLLAVLRRERRTFSVVVDEHGGLAGIATVEDALEQLVGEIADEFDRPALDLRRIGAETFEVSGSLRVSRASELIGRDLPEGEYETVAGLVLDRLGRIPEVGDEVEDEAWSLTVTEMDGVRVRSVVMRVAGDESPSGDDQ